jgi:hypothetical protein
MSLKVNSLDAAVYRYEQLNDPMGKVNAAIDVYKKAQLMVKEAQAQKKDDVVAVVVGKVEKIWADSSQLEIPIINNEDYVYNRILDNAEGYAQFLKLIQK